MALLKEPVSKVRCPKCGSEDVKVEFKRIDSSEASWIRKKKIKCNECGYER